MTTVTTRSPVKQSQGPCSLQITLQDTIYHESGDKCCSIGIDGTGFNGEAADDLQFSSGDCKIVVTAEEITDGNGSFCLFSESDDTLYMLELNSDKILIEDIPLSAIPFTCRFSTDNLSGKIVVVLVEN